MHVVVSGIPSADLTGLLGDCGGLALAVLRHRDHADVIVDTGLQPLDGVLAGGCRDHVFEDGHALSGSDHRDAVTGDGRGVERRPAEADGGVAHVPEGEVGQLRDLWAGGRGSEEKENTGEETRRTTKETAGGGRALDTDGQQKRKEQRSGRATKTVFFQ